jgi:hypothetical protein
VGRKGAGNHREEQTGADPALVELAWGQLGVSKEEGRLGRYHPDFLAHVQLLETERGNWVYKGVFLGADWMVVCLLEELVRLVV